jgi:protein-S-isoprenylcysteine O-methyltransferase Ste14
MKPLPLTAAAPAELPLQDGTVDLSAQIRFVADLAARAAIVVLFSMMAIRFGADFLATGRITGLFLLLSEVLVVVLTVARRSAITIDRSMTARALTGASMAGPPLLAPATVAALASESVTVALSCVGLAIVIAGKAALGRSFALLPANRGIVSSGMYRLVRHPIYMGYLIAHVAYLLANPSVWNITALVLADAALLVRAVREEKTLALDPAYREYQQRVRWRVAPGIF